jgi:hypothetical protein
VSSADLYEAIAFMKAADASRLVLLYPAIESEVELAIGGTKVFEELHVDETRIDAMSIQIRGIATKGGFEKVIRGVRHGVLALMPELV